jgi:hypothetical protein
LKVLQFRTLSILFCVCLIAITSQAAKRILVDEVVASVNRHVITRSEVHQESILILVERHGQLGLSRQLTPEFLGKVMELLINQRVLLDEALRMGVPSVTAEDRQQLLEGFRQRFSDQENYIRFLFQHDLTEETIGDVLARHWKVEILKEKKLRSMPKLTDEEVKKYYEQHRLQLGGKPLELVAEAIRLKLMTQRREKSLARWVWELRKRSQVKILVDFKGNSSASE